MTKAEVAGRARQAMDAMGRRWLLVGPDCSINPDTLEALLRAAGHSVQAAPVPVILTAIVGGRASRGFRRA
jgi:hypothetical protein